eukprot:gene20212-biopygen23544
MTPAVGVGGAVVVAAIGTPLPPTAAAVEATACQGTGCRWQSFTLSSPTQTKGWPSRRGAAWRGVVLSPHGFPIQPHLHVYLLLCCACASTQPPQSVT